jgi:multiple sugar transport system substrate-binding protein
VFGLGYGQTGPVEANGKLLALNTPLKDWSGWTDISRNILNAGTVNGTLYAIMMPDIKVLWYRTDLFKKAGLDPSHGPRTVAQLKDYAKKLTRRKGNGEIEMAGIDISTTNGEQSLAKAMLMYKDIGLWNAKLQPLWDTNTGLEAVTLLNGFIRSKESFFANEYNLAGGPFQNGLAAMRINSFGAEAVYDKSLGANKIAFDVPPGGRAQSGATFLAIDADSHQKGAAVNLLKYLTNAQSQKAIFKGAGFIPTRESVKSWFISLDSAYAKAWTAMEHARTYGPMNPHFFEMLKVLRPALESVYYGKDTAAHALKKSAAQYAAFLK